MSPTPISPNTVHVLLQYISPPSQLSLPLPPYLLSKPLLQRHHFLDISPSDPHEYLCWPAPLADSLKAIHLLESLPRPLDDDEPIAYPVQYTSDDEHTSAHVHITPSGEGGIRLVFQWDENDGWKFHDAKLMPFPTNSTTSLLEALGAHSSPMRIAVPEYPADWNPYGFECEENDSDDDDYWNAYGAQDSAVISPGPLPLSAKQHEAATEDAYWAQYSSVHGTADSTRPSPRPLQRRHYPTLDEGMDHPDSPHPLPVPVRIGDEDTNQEALPIPHLSLSQATARAPWDPASPQTLARLLADISPRPSPGIMQTDDEASSPTFESSGSDELQTPSPPNGLGLVEDGHSLVSPIAEDDAEVQTQEVDEAQTGEWDETDYALQDSIRGLYALWKAEDSLVVDSDLDVWERLLSEQTVLFQRTSSANKALQTRVEELEREVSVWKAALKSADDEKKSLNRTVQKLERNIGSLKDSNPLILCLIDGDGNVFSSDLISLGLVGGHQAASLLTKGLTDHLTDENLSSTTRGQVWLYVYCNKSGLLEALMAKGLCTAEDFEAFVTGFNQASPLFSIVDVGSGKERADEKIKECLRVFTRFPQVTKVFFGGAHDNGYISTLNHLQNEGLLHKIIILRSNKGLGYELRNLGLPILEIDGLFLKKNLLESKPSNTKISSTKKTPLSIQAQDFDKFRTNKGPSSLAGSSRNTTHAMDKQSYFSGLDPDLPLRRQKPPPCNFYYLSECKHGAKCRYGHDYRLSSQDIGELRESSPKWPCPYANRGATCPYGDNCCMGHACPKGRQCAFLKQGKCNNVLPVRAKPPPRSKGKKRKAPTAEPKGDSNSDSELEEPKSKSSRIAKTVQVPEASGGLRRSGRNAGKQSISYAGDGVHIEMERTPKLVSQAAREGSSKSMGSIESQRTQNPKRYGHIPGIEIGTWWNSRIACSIDSVHAPVVAGITSGPDGAYSVALSGGYEDDVDLGEGFTYTGSGGRDLKGTKNAPKNLRTAPQSSDQTWDNPFNSALQRSVESKKPVRVIRGFKLKSPFAPQEGYRYDGLYTVEKAWQEPGLNPKRHLVCKFLFKRVPGQPPLPRLGEEAENSAEEDELELEEDSKSA
ncbi:hypothetical protein BXZ70DRAFT_1070881 [Cristinia sonorae]|uniref:Uncharacterized protein n=1 Tax=Cristinia sonorae TaxID=1940300 RepID=A0A8K0URV2_9AGAR|nr:hypothetical protein BXZ70DRAFT_1070881 [Cristinia sonorae]